MAAPFDPRTICAQCLAERAVEKVDVLASVDDPAQPFMMQAVCMVCETKGWVCVINEAYDTGGNGTPIAE